MPMIRHHDEPGSQAWLQRRLGSFNASDAPAMLGCSTNKTRSALLHELYTSIRPEFSDYVQTRVIDRGHRIEEFMRPIAAEILDEDDLEVIGGSLPVEGLSRPLGASLDGRAMLGRAIWECKSINDELRANLPHEGRDSADKNDGRNLHKMYRVQMEQQLMVDERAQRTLFTAAAVDGNGNVTEERHCWYEPDPALRAEILAGWKVLDADLAAYAPADIKERPAAEVTIALPALVIHAEGKITTSNMKEYGTALAQRLAKVRSIALVTDLDFSNAKAGAKLLREEIVKANAVKAAMLEQTLTVGEAARMIDTWCEDMRVTALQLEKDVEREDRAKKTAMIDKAKSAYEKHIEALKSDTGGPWIVLTSPDWGSALKNKRSFASMQDALDTMLANAKIAADESARKIRAALACMEEEGKGYEFLLADRLSHIGKPVEDIRTLIRARITEHKAKEAAKLEAQREQIRKEEQERADREAREKLAQQEREAEAKRQEEERTRREALIQTQQATRTDIDQAVEKNELAAPLAQDIKSIQDDLTSAAASAQAISTAQRSAAAPAPVEPAGPQTLKVGEIATRLGWAMTAEQLRARGIDPAAKERGSVLYHESQWPQILRALKQHLIALESEAQTATV